MAECQEPGQNAIDEVNDADAGDRGDGDEDGEDGEADSDSGKGGSHSLDLNCGQPLRSSIYFPSFRLNPPSTEDGVPVPFHRSGRASGSEGLLELTQLKSSRSRARPGAPDSKVSLPRFPFWYTTQSPPCVH